MEAKGKDKIEKSTDNLDVGKLEESRILDLAANEKRFNVGKSTRNVSKPDAPRMARTGLQKQGSGVIFGVPKPGKKRKFMEVSKYNVADQSNKNIEANDSLKYLKYMAPQGPGSRGLKNDPKEKRIAESKLKGLKSGKLQAVSGRTVLQRENFSTSAISTSGDSTTGDHTGNVKDSLSNVDNLSRKQNLMETVSFSGSVEPAETPFIFASLAPALDGPSKKISTSTAKSERANKGKLAPASGKLGKIEEDKVFNGNTARSTSEVVEPRRSNRRIQPTSRVSISISFYLMYLMLFFIMFSFYDLRISRYLQFLIASDFFRSFQPFCSFLVLILNAASVFQAVEPHSSVFSDTAIGRITKLIDHTKVSFSFT